jgi:hypothetical protein
MCLNVFIPIEIRAQLDAVYFPADPISQSSVVNAHRIVVVLGVPNKSGISHVEIE